MKFLILVLCAASLTACSSSSYGLLGGAAPPEAPASARKIQRSGSMSMKSRSLKTASETSIALSTQHHATISSSNLTADDFQATIRVPSTHLAPLMTSLKSVGKITHSRINMSDVTEAYRDLDAALKNKRALRDRLRSLLSRATKVEDILKIETELSRVQTELDQMEARMKSMQSKVSHSTLSLSIKRDRIPGPLGAVKDGTNWAVGKLFYLN